jgi:cellulose synthase/poly-beta-1,6-N-acetylglucosamine synthase-like glycosyltransferase
LGLPVLLLQAWLLVVTAYLVLLGAASFFYRRPRQQQTAAAAAKRIAVLVPAHDEATVIERLLGSLAAVDYPGDLYEVFVVADNCTDATAALARSLGASVHERFDLAARGKGQALHWLLQRVPLAEFDAVLVVDADSVVSTNILQVASAALAAGYELAQVYDGVLNRDSSSAAALRTLAFDLHNYVRLLGTEVLGASAGLMGNGMIIATGCLREAGWDAFGLAEDMEVHLKLLRGGRRVHFLADASVLAEMPDSLADSSGQNLRWEAGRLDVAIRHGPRLITQGVKRGSWPQLMAGVETLVPPQSAQVLLSGASLAAAATLGSQAGTRLGLLLLGGQALYLALGLLRLGRRGNSLRALLHAPGYILWKSLLYARVLRGSAGREWVRGTRRSDVTAAETPDRAAV